MTTHDPILSVILIVGDQRERARLCLKSVLEQSLIDQLEVLLLDCSQAGTPPVVGSNHPSVRTLRLPLTKGAGWVRTEGIRQARAPLVAFLEEHAWACPGWAEAILDTLKGPYSAVGPEMGNGNPWLAINRTIAVFYYPIWSPPAIHGPAQHIPHHNAAYKREVLLRYETKLETLMFPETLLHLQLTQDGYQLFLNSQMKILHFFESRLPASWQISFLAERAIEANRQQIFPQPIPMRLFRLLRTPLVPLVRTVRLGQTLARYHPERLDLFLRSLPTIISINIANALGAAAGILFGLGDTPARFLNAQINLPRSMTSEPGGE